MTEKPILFSGPMVRAILSGRKSQTRRIVKSNYGAPAGSMSGERSEESGRWWCDPGGWVLCPYGAPGDWLWVRETWCNGEHEYGYHYRADFAEHEYGPRWHPSIHMPRWASRITLEVTGVRVERLQEISEEDAKAEGAKHMPDHRWHFHEIWDSINGKRAPWASNPWVWVIEFKQVTPCPG